MGSSPRTWFVTIVGWLGIGFGLMAMLAGALLAYGFDKLLSGPDFDADLAQVAADPRVPALVGWLMTHVSLVFFAVGAFGLAVVAASIALLLRRNWGRLGVVATLWFGILVNVAIAALAVAGMLVLPPDMAKALTAGFAEFGGDFQRVAWGLVAVVVGGEMMLVAVLAWIIQQLRGDEARREFGVE